MNLRSFLRNLFGAGSLTALPPMPPSWRMAQYSPKHTEFIKSLGRPMTIVLHAEVHPTIAVQARTPLASTVTNMRASIHVDGTNVTVDWTGGSPVFVLLYRALNSDPWVEISEPTMKRTVTIPLIDTPTAFFLVQEQVPLLTGARTNNVTRLDWRVPELA